MSISAAEIAQIENVFTPKLREAAPLPQGKTIQISAESAFKAKVLDQDGLERHFAYCCEESRKAYNTRKIDYLLWSLKKPFLPPKYKMWVIELMKALDKLNDQNVTSLALPRARGLFRTEELSEWDRMSRYACMDAATFSACCQDRRDYYYTPQIINRAYLVREAYSKRYSDYVVSEQKAPGDRSTFTRVADFLDCAKAVNTYLHKAEAGICTTYAWGAAYPLIDRIIKESRSKSATLLKRVEVVAFTNHIFVIVNREGSTLERNEPIPATSEWGDGVFQVDVWMASLGWPIIYNGVQGDNRCFLTPLKSLFDSTNFFS